MAQSEGLEAEWTGHELFDVDGNRIGRVEDVRYGDVSGGLQWLVVDTGVLGAKKVFVPAGQVRRSGDRLSVGHTKARVKDAPEAENEQVLTQADEGKLCRYYGLQYVPGDQAEGCEEIPDQRPAG